MLATVIPKLFLLRIRVRAEKIYNRMVLKLNLVYFVLKLFSTRFAGEV
jgi:hypothetical protein